jgi:16S rRNA (uracil1498-N3)-methyltransferase
MRQSRVYTRHSLSSSGTVELEGPACHYLLRVLRLSTGGLISLFNGDGKDYLAEISEIRRQSVLVRLTGCERADNESPLKITLVQAVSRGERMDYSLQKATELGVFKIQPVISSRVEVKLDEKRAAKRLAHWQAVVISACEQSGRATVPGVNAPVTLDDWMAGDDESPKLVLDLLSATSLSSVSIAGNSVSLAVGPEGGFTPEEMEGLQSAGARAVSFGPRILRTETAGPAAIAVLQSIAGDL